MKNAWVFAACGLLLLAAAAGANPQKDQESAQAGPGFQGELDFREVGGVVEGTGTIVFDTGTFTGVGTIPAVPDNFAFGNQFGPIPLPFTVTNLSFFMALVNSSTVGSGNAFVTVFGPLNVASTNATPITSANIAGLVANAFNTAALTAAFPGTGSSSFLAGVWNPTAGPGVPTPCANDCVGFDSSGTVGGQGFNGFAMEDLNGGNFTPITNANAILRASGNNVPVELMSFSVESD